MLAFVKDAAIAVSTTAGLIISELKTKLVLDLDINWIEVFGAFPVISVGIHVFV